MNKLEKKLIAYLIDPDLTDTQFREAAHTLTSGKLHRVIDAAWELRRHMRHLLGGDSESPLDEELYDRISALLLREAEMKVPQALDALALELGREERFPAKSSLRGGLIQLLRHGAEPSELLSAASRTKEKKSGLRSKSDWPLK